MKRLIIVLSLLGNMVFAQNSLQNKIMGEWVKDEIKLADNSPVYDVSIKESRFRYNFYSTDYVQITYNGKTNKNAYRIDHDTLVINDHIKFKIAELSDIKLILDQIDEDIAQHKKLRLIFIPAHIYNVGFVPKHYLSKGGDTVYVSEPNYLEPYFMNEDTKASDYIYQQFNFPDYRHGLFTVRFVITKNSELVGARVLKSSNEKFNERLLKAVNKTAKMWKAANYEGKNVNSEVEIVFDLDWTVRNPAEVPASLIEKDEESQIYSDEGINMLEEGAYNKAIEFFNEALKQYSFNLDAYYGRAAAYVLLKKPQMACKDFLVLKNLGQVRATQLYEKYCKNVK